MGKIYYDATTTIGGKMVAEFADSAIDLKDKADRLASILKETTNDGNLCSLIEEGGAHATVFGVLVGQGANLYQAVTALRTALSAISDDTLADLDMGG